MTRNQERCPICGTPKLKETKQSKIECTKCGYPYAFVKNFAGRQSFEAWKNMIEDDNKKRIYNIHYDCEKNHSFLLLHDGLVYLSPDQNTLSLIKEKAELSEVKVKQFDASERNRVWLMKDGTVRADGENTFNQLDIQSWKEIEYICAAPECIYAIQKDKTVVWSGSVFNSEIQTWNEIIKLACGNYHLVGLKKNGSVCIAGNMLDSEMKKEVESWNDIIDISASGDCTLGLTRGGEVRFAGRKTDKRKEALNWSNIIAVAADSVYAFGLTATGTVLVAGECKSSFLDMGRKDAGNWKEIVEITCCRSGIAGIEKNGTLHLAGNIQGKNEIQKKYTEKYQEKVAENFMKWIKQR